MEVPENLREIYELILQSLPTQRPVDVILRRAWEAISQTEPSTATMIFFKNTTRSMCGAPPPLRSRFLVLPLPLRSGEPSAIEDETEKPCGRLFTEQFKNDVFS